MPLQVINAFRGNFLIAFAGAALIIFAIKVTPLLLPAKYYFSFSSIMGSGTEPFIVDTPGVTGKRLCAVLEKYDIPKERFQHVNCTLDYLTEEEGSGAGGSFSPEEKDRIYTVAIQGDPQLRSDIGAKLQGPQVVPPTEEEVGAVLSQSGSVSQVFDKLFDSYKSKLDPLVDDAIGTKVKDSFAADVAASEAKAGGGQTDEGAEEEAGAGRQLPEEISTKIFEASRRAAARLGQAQLAGSIDPITKSDVDKAIRESYGWYGIDGTLVGYYKHALSEDHVRKVLMEEFKAAGLDVRTPDEDRRLVFAEINKFSWFDYVVSIIVRVAPVVLVGVLLGFLFGRGEVLSIGVAGAVAAFLLTWPLMLMWERLVQSSWQNKKTIFLMFYLAYIVVFFITARTSAMIGAKLEGTGQGYISGVKGGTPSDPLSWGSILANIVATAMGNVAIYIGNVIIPLQALADD